mgnify:CR=1 FL=1
MPGGRGCWGTPPHGWVVLNTLTDENRKEIIMYLLADPQEVHAEAAKIFTTRFDVEIKRLGLVNLFGTVVQSF